MSEVPRAVCFPRDDPLFAERVESLLDDAHGEGPFPAAVQALLRESYPQAVVRPRHELAAFGREGLWYVFRDGTATPIVSTEAP
jgi:hypothetical protein